MSWKKYGGIKNMESMNNLTVQNIVTDTFTVREAFLNLITINGGLIVNGPTNLNDILNVTKTVTLSEKLIVYQDTSLNTVTASNLEVINTITTKNNYISENLFVQGNIFLGPNQDIFVHGNSGNFGINTYNPTATLDISGASNESINVYTSNTINKNILARNVNNQGIVLLSDTSGAYIEFFTETPIPQSNNDVVQNDLNYVADASMSYHIGGILELNAKNLEFNAVNDVKISSDVIINKKNTSGHLLQEPVIIYDIPAGTYFYNSYQKSTIKTGNALTLVANDISSNTFLNIININKQGAAFGGGAYPIDLSRNMAVIGVLDISGTLTPHQLIVSGNSTVKTKATVGFNTFAPKVDLYSVNINGPLKITNGEITAIVEPDIQVLNIGFSKNINYKDGVTIVGTPYPSSITSNLYYTWNSSNGGQTFKKQQMVDNNNNIIIGASFYGSTAYNNNITILSGSSQTLLYTLNAGSSWGKIGGFNTGSDTILNTTAIIDYLTSQRVFVVYINNFFYFDISINTLNPNSTTITPSTVSTDISASTIDCDIYGNYFHVAGGKIIKTYNILSTPILSYTYTNTVTDASYNSISAGSNTYIVAVGTNIISYTKNSGATWTDFNFTGKTFNSVYVNDAQNAIAVGNGGIIYYTNNGSSTWQSVHYDVLNTSGIADLLIDPTHNLASVFMPNINSIIISSIITPYVSGSFSGQSKIFYVYVPNLFNITNNISNTVLDICGNMVLSGSVVISGQINQF